MANDRRQPAGWSQPGARQPGSRRSRSQPGRQPGQRARRDTSPRQAARDETVIRPARIETLPARPIALSGRFTAEPDRHAACTAGRHDDRPAHRDRDQDQDHDQAGTDRTTPARDAQPPRPRPPGAPVPRGSPRPAPLVAEPEPQAGRHTWPPAAYHAKPYSHAPGRDATRRSANRPGTRAPAPGRRPFSLSLTP
jgi:hypothetical protein